MTTPKLWITVLLAAAVAWTSSLYSEDDEAQSEVAPLCLEHELEECVFVLREAFRGRGTLGFLTRQAKGMADAVIRWRVVDVLDGSAVGDAGLRKGDAIVAFDDEPLPPGSPEPVVRAFKAGQEIKITVQRGAEQKNITVTAREPSDGVVEAWITAYLQENYTEQEFRRYMTRLREARTQR